MEPVTHILTGACLARTGFNRRAAYATAAMAIAAEFPDIDTLWSLRGPIAGFEHHRGITHSFLGLPFEAALLLLGFLAYHKWRTRSAASFVRTGSHRHAPVRWVALYGLLLLALCSHLLLDYTNNYGIRPFFPFHDAWYAASIVFIFDPLLFTLLLAGLLLPLLFGLISREIGARREPYRGRGWARAALAGVVLLWIARAVEHGQALALAQAQTLRAPAPDPSLAVLDRPTAPDTAVAALTTETAVSPQAPNPGPDLQSPGTARPLLRPQRALASPDPFSIFRWYTATDFGPAYQLGHADTRRSTLQPDEILAKSPMDATVAAAEGTHLGRVYLDWSAMPLIRVTGDTGTLDVSSMAAGDEQLVTFTDLRFYGDLPLLKRNNQPPLSGQVLLDRKGRVLAEGMDGRFRH